MIWIASSEKDTDHASLEIRLCAAAGQAVPAPQFAEADYNRARPEGLLVRIFLRFAEVRFRQIQNLRRTRDLLLPRLLSWQAGTAAVDEAICAWLRCAPSCREAFLTPSRSE